MPTQITEASNKYAGIGGNIFAIQFTKHKKHVALTYHSSQSARLCLHLKIICIPCFRPTSVRETPYDSGNSQALHFDAAFVKLGGRKSEKHTAFTSEYLLQKTYVLFGLFVENCYSSFRNIAAEKLYGVYTSYFGNIRKQFRSNGCTYL